MTDTAVTVALVTAPTHDVAEHIVRTVVEERLAACGSIVPGVTSIFRWDDAVGREDEVLVVFKTMRAAVPRLMSRIEEMHPYDVPEFLALPVAAALESYANWVASSVDV